MTTSSAKAALRWYAALSPAAHALACDTHARTHGAQHRRRSVASQIWRRMKRRRSDRSGAPRIGPANEGGRERGRGGGPHGDGGLGGARRRRRGVEVPQQDPLPVDGLLHCSPSVAAGTRARTRWEGGQVPRWRWVGVICRRGEERSGRVGWGKRGCGGFTTKFGDADTCLGWKVKGRRLWIAA